MSDTFDFIVVGAGSSGAVVAARLSEDGSCRVALLEAGERPPDAELMPIACASMQKNPATDWMYTADAGGAGLGLLGGRVPVPRGKMLGGSSGLNYMAWVRGHPGDFDHWAANGATGWSYADVLPYFKKSESFTPCDDVVVDAEAHSSSGPLGVSVRSPILPGAREFVAAAQAAGIPRGDYNGRDRGGARGVSSLLHTSTRAGKRSSTYHAFLEGSAEACPNLTIISGVHVTRVLLEVEGSGVHAAGVEYRSADGALHRVFAQSEVILSAGAIGSPHLLMLSGVGPKRELEGAGIVCAVDSPHLGKHLKDHIQVPLFFPESPAGVSMAEVAAAMEPAALAQWATTGCGLISSSLYDAACWFSTALGDHHSHDAQIACIPCGYTEELWHNYLHVDTTRYFDNAARRLEPDARNVIIFANPVLQHSEGEIALTSSCPTAHPTIRMNYYSDPYDMKVMKAVLRRAFEIAARWPARRLGPWLAPPQLAAKHSYTAGVSPSDSLLEDLARYFSITVYHLTSTCRIGSVVDPQLRVNGVRQLRVADASVMPGLVSGNTNAACVMIGEKAAEMVAADHRVKLKEFVGTFGKAADRVTS
jgi:choline dehydrogenase-like flavoprotein